MKERNLTRLAILDLDKLFVLTTENLGPSYGSRQTAEIQITQEHACGINFEQCRCDDTFFFSGVALGLDIVSCLAWQLP